MKPFFARLAAVLTGCLLCVSCLNDGDFYMENIAAFATVLQGQLVTDAGAVLNVTEDQSGLADWRQNGNRFLVVYDILNADMDVRLRSLTPMQICRPTPEDPALEQGQDPVYIGSASLGGSFLNLILGVYQAKGSTLPQVFSCEYKDDPQRNQMFLILHCDGHQENPTTLPADQLETVRGYCSIPLYELLKGISRNLNLVYDTTATLDDGSVVMVSDTLCQAGNITVGF